jgi:formate--tetrahydrofolate ligase
MSKQYLSDLEIAQQSKMAPIPEIAEKLGLTGDDYDLYGKYIAKVRRGLYEDLADRPDGKLVLVTAITPTPAGEGKSTTAVGLGDALRVLGRKSIIAIREPSLGPCFGTKGGATGGGWAQVQPMEDINLHFTGDIHAVTTAHNLLTAMTANHLHQGNELDLDARRVTWQHVMDLNARHLRDIVVALGGYSNGFPMESGFSISTASEVMAILCLATSVANLKERLGNIVVGQTRGREFVMARDLKADGAMAALLKDAIRPNLVQTLERTPAFIHGGPFANIAHGCNSIIATRLARKLGDIVVTEAGFGSELGAEKFFDIKCRMGGLVPDAVVLVATIRALRLHGGVKIKEVTAPNPTAVEEGLENLGKHIENIKHFGITPTVAMNAFVTDAPEEWKLVEDYCAERGVKVGRSEVWEHGGKGGVDLAEKVVEVLDGPAPEFRFLYDVELPLQKKIEIIATKLYGAEKVTFLKKAKTQLGIIARNGYDKVPVCIAKTPASLSADPKLQGVPKDFTLEIENADLRAGAGFVVAYAGDIMTMPGLGKVPAAVNINLGDDGTVRGLF